jgi:hypothetical protein
MKNKYYTPEIEEFHVGFEYERNQYDNNIWFKYVVERKDVLDHSDKDIRVKYLDREDIESLGFEQTDRVNSIRYVKGNVSVWLGDVNKKMLTKIEKRDLLRAAGKTCLFMGNIKNKSEFKVILKQLNIN